MSVAPLKKLTITHLRGAVEPFELPFEKDKKLTIVYGENGTGKSTICDALEFLSKGKVGSLDNRGLGKTNQYWNAVSKSAADVSVTLETSNSTCRAWMVKSDVVAQPADARPRVEVLRRTQILALLEARPGERYEAIRRFVDVSPIEESENSLRQLIRSMNNSRNTAATRILELIQLACLLQPTNSSACVLPLLRRRRRPLLSSRMLHKTQARQSVYCKQRNTISSYILV